MGKKKNGFNKKELSEITKEREELNNKILGMKFDDFKKAIVESIDGLEDGIADTIKWNADQVI